MTAALTAFIWGLLARYGDAFTRVSSAAALSFVPAFLVAFTTENLIAGAGNAVTMSFALLVAMSWTAHFKDERGFTKFSCELHS